MNFTADFRQYNCHLRWVYKKKNFLVSSSYLSKQSAIFLGERDLNSPLIVTTAIFLTYCFFQGKLRSLKRRRRLSFLASRSYKRAIVSKVKRMKVNKLPIRVLLFFGGKVHKQPKFQKRRPCAGGQSHSPKNSPRLSDFTVPRRSQSFHDLNRSGRRNPREPQTPISRHADVNCSTKEAFASLRSLFDVKIPLNISLDLCQSFAHDVYEGEERKSRVSEEPNVEELRFYPEVEPNILIQVRRNSRCGRFLSAEQEPFAKSVFKIICPDLPSRNHPDGSLRLVLYSSQTLY